MAISFDSMAREKTELAIAAFETFYEAWWLIKLHL